jgi:hypothetical protein
LQQGGLRKGFLDAAKPAPKPVLKKVSSFDGSEARAQASRQEEEAAQREQELARAEEGRQAAFSGSVVEREVLEPVAGTHDGINGSGSPSMQPFATGATGHMPTLPEGQQAQAGATTKRVSRFKQQRAGL